MKNDFHKQISLVPFLNSNRFFISEHSNHSFVILEGGRETVCASCLFSASDTVQWNT